MKFITLVFTLLLLSVLAIAQSPTPAPIDLNNSVADWLNAHMATLVTWGSLLISEIVMRVVPTAKPMSWLYAASMVLKWATNLLTTVSKVLDGILQNQTPPSA
jgi:hypothetical protein